MNQPFFDIFCGFVSPIHGTIGVDPMDPVALSLEWLRLPAKGRRSGTDKGLDPRNSICSCIILDPLTCHGYHCTYGYQIFDYICM